MENIRDNSYKSPEEIRRIQHVVGFLGQVSARPAIPDPRAFDVVIERTEIAQTDFHNHLYDSEGNYHDPRLRTEHLE